MHQERKTEKEQKQKSKQNPTEISIKPPLKELGRRRDITESLIAISPTLFTSEVFIFVMGEKKDFSFILASTVRICSRVPF